MNREIKFMAWDVRGQKKYEVDRLIKNSEGGWLCFTPNNKFPLAEYILMQYTGLKDNNGKEIYEGDITNYGVVTWFDNLSWDSGGSRHPGFYFKDQLGTEDEDLSYHIGFYDDIEVIGNIHEK